MTTYQFEFRHSKYGRGGADLVVDITADRRADAVGMMRLLAEEWAADDDPVTIEVDDSPAVYARVWINIDPQTINEECIVDEWEE